jgi:hypothetical protein
MAFTENGLSKLEEMLKGHVAKGSAPGLWRWWSRESRRMSCQLAR